MLVTYPSKQYDKINLEAFKNVKMCKISSLINSKDFIYKCNNLNSSIITSNVELPTEQLKKNNFWFLNEISTDKSMQIPTFTIFVLCTEFQRKDCFWLYELSEMKACVADLSQAFKSFFPDRSLASLGGGIWTGFQGIGL